MTEEEAQRLNGIRASAESKLDELQDTLSQLNSMASDARSEANRNMNTWQTWLGAIAFSLAAISGVALVSELGNYWALLATLVFIGTGVSITVSTKKRFEKDSIDATKSLDEARPLIENQKELAWRIYEDPTSYEEINPLLQQARRVSVKHSLVELDLMIAGARKGGITYLSDIWLALITTGLYLLLIQTGLDFYSNAKLLEEVKSAIFVLPWLLLMLIITNDALKGADLVKDAKTNDI